MFKNVTRRIIYLSVAALLVIVIGLPDSAEAQGLPTINFGIQSSDEPEDVAITLQILALMTILSLAPSILIMMTSFTRIIIVFHFLRMALGTQQMPPTQLLVGLALFITMFIMAPIGTQVNETALKPFIDKEIGQQEAFDRAMLPIKGFMLAQTREKDLGLFMHIVGAEKPENASDVPTTILIPSFIISELHKGFQIGFVLYIPLLIIDLVVASILMSMGMMMLPPVMISLPFKILLFVLVDGWNLIIGSVVSGITF